VNINGTTHGCADLTSYLVFLEEVRVTMQVVFLLFQGYKLLFMLNLWTHLCFGTCLKGCFLQALVRKWFFFRLSCFFFGSTSGSLESWKEMASMLSFLYTYSTKVFHLFREKIHCSSKLAILAFIHKEQSKW